MNAIYRWRVWFSNGTPPRDVTARTEDGARKTALAAERLTGNRTRVLRVLSVQRLWEVGYAATRRYWQAQDAATGGTGQ